MTYEDVRMQVRPGVRKLLRGESATMSQGTVSRIEALLDAVAVYGSESLRQSIDGLKKQIQSGMIFKQLKIKVAK